MVGDDAVGVERQKGGDEDQEHDVDEGEDVVLKLVAHKVGHVRHGPEGARGLEGVVVAHPHFLPAVGDHLDCLRGDCDQPLSINHHLNKAREDESVKQVSGQSSICIQCITHLLFMNTRSLPCTKIQSRL